MKMKKNFENMPFRVGDEIYHPVYGKGIIVKIDDGVFPVSVKFDDMVRYFSNNTICLLSFTPYELNSNWERPFEPKDGDVVYREYRYTSCIEIHKEYTGERIFSHASLSPGGIVGTRCDWALKSNLTKERAATEEEKKQLFDALAERGKRWNADKKCIEDDDTPRIGDKCIFWDDNTRYSHVGVLNGIREETAYRFRSDYKIYFKRCIKYSDEKLIELMNSGL